MRATIVKINFDMKSVLRTPTLKYDSKQQIAVSPELILPDVLLFVCFYYSSAPATLPVCEQLSVKKT
jgi:hypothetical protein